MGEEDLQRDSEGSREDPMGTWTLVEAAEVMKSGRVLEILCSLSQQDILMGATWGIRQRELFKMTAMFSLLS